MTPAVRGLGERQQELEAFIRSEDLLLRTRVIFFLFSLLGALWIHLLAWQWSESRAEAALAAGLLAFSWELGYHARWIAPDALMAQSAALTVLCVYVAPLP